MQTEAWQECGIQTETPGGQVAFLCLCGFLATRTYIVVCRDLVKQGDLINFTDSCLLINPLPALRLKNLISSQIKCMATDSMTNKYFLT